LVAKLKCVRFSVNIPKTDEYNAGKITGVRVSNTTISAAKKTR